MLFGKSQRERDLALTETLQQDYTRLFVDVGRALTSNLRLEEVLTEVMEKMSQYFAPERWSLMLVDHERHELYYAIAVGQSSESLQGMRVPIGEGVSGWVALTGNPVVVPDTSLEPRWIEYTRRIPGLDVHSIACVPVRSESGVVGVVQLLNAEVDLLSDYALQFLSVLCDFSAVAIRNATDMKRIHELSITDDCTGLFNARHLYDTLDERIQVAPDEKFSLLFMDLDHFKRVNDVYGHLVGSRLLNEAGTLVRKTMGPENPAYRYGGDEFVVLLPEQDKELGVEMARMLFYRLRNHRFLGSERMALELRASFGLATYPEDGDSMDAIIKAADRVMYEAKEATRDNIAVAGRGLVFRDGRREPYQFPDRHLSPERIRVRPASSQPSLVRR